MNRAISPLSLGEFDCMILWSFCNLIEKNRLFEKSRNLLFKHIEVPGQFATVVETIITRGTSYPIKKCMRIYMASFSQNSQIVYFLRFCSN